MSCLAAAHAVGPRALTTPRHGARHARSRVNRVVTAAQSRSMPGDGPSNGQRQAFDAEEAVRRLPEAQKLVAEITEIALGAGPAAVPRTISAAQSLARLAMRNAQTIDLSAPDLGIYPPKLLRQTFESLGATYVKIGQFVASAPSVFPAEYVEEFQKCLDSTEPTDFSVIKRTVEKDLGIRSIDEVFTSFDSTPLASASVAQVHRAVLKSGNKEVVVKVLKPDVEDTLKADLSFVLVVSKVLQFLNPELSRTSLVDIVGDIRASMLEEVDFKKEAQNIDAFRRYLDDADLNSIAKAPFVYSQFSGNRVMTMEYFKGVALTDLDAIRNVSRGDPEATLVNALNVWFGSVLACESFHADVHAGNLIVCEDGKVGFIDFGIVGRIPAEIFGAVQAFFQATAARDYDRMALALETMGATEGSVDKPKFAADLRAIYEALDAIEPTVAVDGEVAAVSVDQAQVTRLATDLVTCAEENRVKLPRAFGILFKQLIYFDRYVQLLAPDMDVIDDDRVAFVDTVAVDVGNRRLGS